MDRAFSRFRVAMYSHDTFGLGHLTRTLRLARAVVETIPDASVMVLTGSPWADRVALPAGVECVQLPSVQKRGADDYVSRDPEVPFRRLRMMRTMMLHDTVLLFRPHVLFVDNVPLGMKGELVRTLEAVRHRLPGTRIHLNLRDVLDDPAVVRAQWDENGVDEVLDRVYDEIHVFGEAAVYDAVDAYQLPAEKTRFLGYIAPYGDVESRPAAPPPGVGQAHRVLVTTGGGEDGVEILRSALALQEGLGPDSPFRFDLVLGPFVPQESRDLLLRSRGTNGVRLHDWVEHLSGWMSGYDAVVSMGGYNTLCEVLAAARRSVVVPRVTPRREQEIRAVAFESRGLVRRLPFAELSPDSLERVLRGCLAEEPSLPSPRVPSLEGLRRFKDRLREIAGLPGCGAARGADAEDTDLRPGRRAGR